MARRDTVNMRAYSCRMQRLYQFWFLCFCSFLNQALLLGRTDGQDPQCGLLGRPHN